MEDGINMDDIKTVIHFYKGAPTPVLEREWVETSSWPTLCNLNSYKVPSRKATTGNVNYIYFSRFPDETLCPTCLKQALYLTSKALHYKHGRVLKCQRT